MERNSSCNKISHAVQIAEEIGEWRFGGQQVPLCYWNPALRGSIYTGIKAKEL